MQSVYDFMKKCGTYYLATIDGNSARVRPFGTVDLYNGKLYIQTGAVKPVSKQILENPNVEICCFDGEKWLRLAGNLVLDDDVSARKHMLDNYPELRAMYDENDGNTEVFYFEHATATFSSFTAPSSTVKW